MLIMRLHTLLLLRLQEPWVNDAVVIGGASAVLSPIIQWGHTILQSKPQVLTSCLVRRLLFVYHHQSHQINATMWIYASIAVLLLLHVELNALRCTLHARPMLITLQTRVS